MKAHCGAGGWIARVRSGRCLAESRKGLLRFTSFKKCGSFLDEFLCELAAYDPEMRTVTYTGAAHGTLDAERPQGLLIARAIRPRLRILLRHRRPALRRRANDAGLR